MVISKPVRKNKKTTKSSVLIEPPRRVSTHDRIINVLKKLPNNDSIFEILVVHVNDKLVDLFLKKKIKFNQISSKLLKIIEGKEFKKYKHIKANNIREIKDIINYLSLKIDYLSV
mgnify:CR=1 FL=1